MLVSSGPARIDSVQAPVVFSAHIDRSGEKKSEISENNKAGIGAIRV